MNNNYEVKIMKKIIYVMIAIVCLNTSTTHAEQVFHTPANQKTASYINIYVNGSKLSPDVPCLIENSSIFVPIRFIGEAMKAKKIQWYAYTKMVYMEIGTQQITLSINSNEVIVNNKKIRLKKPIELYQGRTFVSAQFITDVLGYNVQWNKNQNVITIHSSSHYSQEDVYWLSRIVEAEARGESYDGKLAVANVVINRRNNSQFPNTIKGVIFDKKYGVQFTPIINGSIYNAPSIESIDAAKQALSGKNNIEKCLYFCNPRIAGNSWIIRNRAFYKKIDNHCFYS